MKNLINHFAILCLFFFLSGCKKNELAEIRGNSISPFNAGAIITTSVAGKVIAQNGAPLNNVEITIGSATVVTDISGTFIIPNASINQKAGLIKAKKEGYFNGSRTIIPNENTVNDVVIQMIKKTETGNFATSSGGTITVGSSGAKVQFAPNSIVTKSGATYSGTVKVSAYFLDPTSDDCDNEMPGDLRGISTSNAEQFLTSYGMLNVELNGSNGEELQIASGKTATIITPIASSIQANAPATIPLWYFDETKGMWVEEGVATKNGNVYEGNVKHFTWWNCDYGGPIVRIKLKVVDQNGNPLPFVEVKLTRTNVGLAAWASTSSGYTASNGTLTGSVPTNESFIVELFGSIGTTICQFTTLTTTIGPFAQNTNIGNIVANVSTPSFISVKAIVKDCNNLDVTNGYAWYEFNGLKSYAEIANGVLNINQVFCGSVPFGTMSIEVFDLATLKKNLNPISVNISSGGVYNVGNIQACGIKDFVNYKAKFVDQNGIPLNANNSYVLYSVDTLPLIYPNNGEVKLIFPANKIITQKVFVLTSCGNYEMVDSSQIGPFASDFNAGTIVVNIPTVKSFTLTGTVNNCSGLAVAKGLAEINVEGIVHKVNINNGVFTHSFVDCRNVNQASITFIDFTTNQQNTSPSIVNLNSPNINVGTIQVCGTTLNEFLNYTVGSDTYYLTLNDSIASNSFNGVTYIGGNGINPYNYIHINFNGTSVGSFTLNKLDVYSKSPYELSQNNPITVTITEFGNVGGYIAGSFSGTVFESRNPTNAKTINANFRIKRY